MEAKLVKIEEEKHGFDTKKVYYYECVRCGTIYSKRRRPQKPTAYCDWCKRVLAKELESKSKEKQEKKIKQIRASALNDLWKMAISKYDEMLSLEELAECIGELEEKLE